MHPAAQIIATAALLVLSVAVWLLIKRRGLSTFRAKVGPVSIDLAAVEQVRAIAEATHHEVQQINKAVNNVPPGTPSLVARTATLEAWSVWTAESLRVIAAHDGIELPPSPKES